MACESRFLDLRRLADWLSSRSSSRAAERTLAIERVIKKSLERTNGNKRQAAKLLNLKRTTLIEKLKRLNGGTEADRSQN